MIKANISEHLQHVYFWDWFDFTHVSYTLVPCTDCTALWEISKIRNVLLQNILCHDASSCLYASKLACFFFFLSNDFPLFFAGFWSNHTQTNKQTCLQMNYHLNFSRMPVNHGREQGETIKRTWHGIYMTSITMTDFCCGSLKYLWLAKTTAGKRCF